MNTENKDKEAIVDENTVENNVSEMESAPELSVEEKLQEELANEKDKFLRLFAEFENFKRRTSKERMELFKTANQDVLIALLPILDDFDRAMIYHMHKGNSLTKSYNNALEIFHNRVFNYNSDKLLLTDYSQQLSAKLALQAVKRMTVWGNIINM